MDEKRLATLISEFVQTTPSEIIGVVVNFLEVSEYFHADIIKSKLLSTIQSPQANSKLRKLLDSWIKDCPQLPAHGLAMAIRSSVITVETSQKPLLDLVWTGPTAQSPLRRTDQALLELIDTARKRLILVSFAVYKAQEITEAIDKALRRNVEVIICLEEAKESQGKISFSGKRAFSSAIFRLASFYYWPLENRKRTKDGKFGALHAKVAVSDGKRAFISSANLTDYAMNLNMEMGVLINGGDIPEQMERLFDDLILTGVLVRVQM